MDPLLTYPPFPLQGIPGELTNLPNSWGRQGALGLPRPVCAWSLRPALAWPHFWHCDSPLLMCVLEQRGICGSHSEAPGPSAPVRMAAVHSCTHQECPCPWDSGTGVSLVTGAFFKV